MIKLLLLTFISFASDNFHTLNHTVAYNVESNYEKGFCSGAFVEKSGEEFFISAAHCFAKVPKKEVVEAFRLNSSSKKVKSSKTKIKITTKANFSYRGDRIVTKTKRVTRGIRPLVFSENLPFIGEEVFALGFPKGKRKREIARLKCEYLGSNHYYTDRTPMSLGRVLKCFTNAKSLSGISGGAVVSKTGEYFGVLSSELQPSRYYKFSGKRYVYLTFNEVYSQGQFINSESEREIDRLLFFDRVKYEYYESDL